MWTCSPCMSSRWLASIRRMSAAACAGGEAELGSCVARQDVGMGVGHDTGYDSTRTACWRPSGTVASSRSTSSGPSTTTSPIPWSTTILDLFVALGVAVQHEPSRVCTCLDGRQDLSATRNVESSPSSPSPAGPRCTGKPWTRTPRESSATARPVPRHTPGLWRVGHPRRRPERGLELRGQAVGAAPADREHSITVDGAARGKQG